MKRTFTETFIKQYDHNLKKRQFPSHQSHNLKKRQFPSHQSHNLKKMCRCYIQPITPTYAPILYDLDKIDSTNSIRYHSFLFF